MKSNLMVPNKLNYLCLILPKRAHYLKVDTKTYNEGLLLRKESLLIKKMISLWN